jgi:sugar lactone lactonase YvrE
MTIDAQAVPSSLAVGPDGGLYVGELRGQPSLPGTADIYRVVPGRSPAAVVTGLTRVTDLAFDHKGRLLVLERSTGGGETTAPGALLRVTLDRDGARASQITTLPVSGLVAPVGLAVGPNDDVYITNYGASSGTANPSGEVLEVSHLG